MAEKLKNLLKKRSSYKSKLTIYNNNLALLKSSTELSQLQYLDLAERFNRFETLYADFDTLQTDIEILSEDAETAFAEREDFERQYFQSVAVSRSLLSIHNNGVGPETSIRDGDTGAQNIISNKHNFVRLPKIDLPHFDGSYEHWLEFRDTFKSLIHDNNQLDEINKFHYLRASLQGTAALIIKNLDFKGEHYKIAWELLCERYNDNRILVNNHLQALFDIKPMSTDSSVHIRNLVDVINKNVRALTTLNQPTRHWDTVLIFIMSKKLSLQTSSNWEEHRGSLQEDPTLSQFCTFLSRKASLLETIESSHNYKLNGVMSSNVNKINLKNQQISNYYKNTTKCPLCSKPHLLYQCESFRSLPIENRIHKANTLNVCLNCLRFGHFAKNCNGHHCKYCEAKHNTLLHLETQDNNPLSNQPSSSAMASTSRVALTVDSRQLATSAHVLLSTALVNVVSATGKKQTARLLLDNGSTANFVTQDLTEKLGLSRRSTNTKVTGINSHTSVSTQSCNITVESLCCAFTIEIECNVIPQITNVLPPKFINIQHIPIPPEVRLVDPNFNVPSAIDILVGAEIFWSILSTNYRKLGKNQPTLCETKFGWLVSGSIPHKSSFTDTHHCHHTNVTPDLSKFWELDNVPEKHTNSLEEKLCEQHFDNTTIRKHDGQFVVTMPLKMNPNALGNSYENAKNRLLALERRFKRDPTFKVKYDEFLREYERLGHMTLTSSCNNEYNVNYVIPHHGVIRTSSTTTQLRVVFDASATTSTGISLNDIQMVGPVVQDDLFSILLRFRQHKFVVTSDVEKMYRAIEITPNQRHLQKILFRFDESEPIKTYTLNTVTYGNSSSPYLATKCLVSLAADITDNRVKRAIQRDFYVDDYLSGGSSIEETVEISQRVQTILSSAKFNLRKWRSNNLDILNEITNKNQSTDPLSFSEQNPISTQSKTLGLNWISDSDTFTFTFNLSPATKITKRHILSVISQMFDPLGFLGPCVVEAKMIMQRLWLDKCDWDGEVSHELTNLWQNFEKGIASLNNLKIPRWVLCEDNVIHELHIFTDASERAYGACVYVRTLHNSGLMSVRLLVSKNRVAPIKPTTMPRLELCGALLGARLCTRVQDSLTISIKKCRFWCDSTIVLAWLAMATSQLKPFVRHRVNEIQESTCGHTWNYVPSKDNPADLVSRGIRADLIADTSLWWHGPAFLLQNESQWPVMPISGRRDLPEVATHLITSSSSNENNLYHSRHTTIHSDITHRLLERLSSLPKIQRVVSYLHRFIHNCKNKMKLRGDFSRSELQNALNFIIRDSQRQMFPEEYEHLISGQKLPRKSRLRPLTPFIDEHNLLRVGGRLDNSPYDFNTKHPIILCSKHQLTKLIFNMQHLKLLHCGPQLLLSNIRQNYWPLGGKNLSRLIVHKCLKCFRFKAQQVQPIMGQLPRSRTNLEYPFYDCFVDYAGPMLIADRKGRGCKLTKSYMCIFVCSAVKAVHLELVSDLTTEAYMAALNRFVARRGKPRSITSDNGTNFVGASNEIRRFFNSSGVAIEMAREGIEFHFTPAYSPHFNSLAEAAVKSSKHHLKRILNLTHLTFEEMYTCLSNIEAILNSRPLTPLSTDPNEFSALTPSHFLIGRPLLSVPQTQVAEANITRMDRWKRIQLIRQHFWSRFHNEYTNLLQTKTKWFHSNGELKLGALVLIKDKTSPPLLWPLGRVTKVYPGVDGVARVAEIKTSKGTYHRAFNSICPLPQPEDLDE